MFKAVSWLTGLILALIPLLVSLDSGGVLPWSKWAASVAVMVACGLVIPELFGRQGLTSLRSLMVPLAMLVLAGFAGLQSVPVPNDVLARIAPESAVAYELARQEISMAPPAGLASPAASSLSLDRWQTSQRAAWFATLALLGFAAAQRFVDRNGLPALLVCVALAGAVQAALGIFQILTDPTATVWGIKSFLGGTPFGSFVGRSASAVMMNLGLASALGLISWRLAALTGTAFSDDRFPFTEILDIAFDRLALFSMVCCLFCFAGLLACGSRGGLVGTVAGLLCGLGIFQSAFRGRGLIATLLATALMAGILLVQFELPANTLDRLQDTPDQVLIEGELQDGRLDHWADGWQAAKAQLWLGWGIGAYRYAYLPFQRYSAGGWFHNADNLWLEWLVEAGIFGWVLVALLFIFVLISLRRLGNSPDPMDHGLATAGWFVLGAMATSQFFDFGLIIPANSMGFVMILSALVARAWHGGSGVAYVAPASKATLNRSDSRSSKSAWLIHVGRLGLVACFLVAAWFGNRYLEAEARADHLRRLAHHLPRATQYNLEIAGSLSDSLSAHLNDYPHDAESRYELSRLLIDSARYTAASRLIDIQQKEAWIAEYRSLAPAVLRELWYQLASDKTQPAGVPLLPIQADGNADSLLNRVSPPSNQEVADTRTKLGQAFVQARDVLARGVLSVPLSDQLRNAFVGLDFAGGNPEQSAAIIARSIELRSRNASNLQFLGNLAAQGKQWELAGSAWRQTVALEPNRVPEIAKRMDDKAPYSITTLLGNDPTAIAFAVQYELGKVSPNKAMLASAIPILSQSLPEDRRERTARLQLIAQMQLIRDQYAAAAESLGQAVALNPGNNDLRYQHIVALRAAGKIAEARQQARAGKRISPADKRFDELLTSMSTGEE